MCVPPRPLATASLDTHTHTEACTHKAAAPLAHAYQQVPPRLSYLTFRAVGPCRWCGVPCRPIPHNVHSHARRVRATVGHHSCIWRVRTADTARVARHARSWQPGVYRVHGLACAVGHPLNTQHVLFDTHVAGNRGCVLGAWIVCARHKSRMTKQSGRDL
eukprot:1136240-Pelagomonas_calceolata.AAC.9